MNPGKVRKGDLGNFCPIKLEAITSDHDDGLNSALSGSATDFSVLSLYWDHSRFTMV